MDWVWRVSIAGQDGLAARPSSLAGQLLQGQVFTCKSLVGCQVAFAGKPRSYKGFAVHASLFTTHQAER
ncbi:hypothetical protein C1X33_08515 [Pseudomonas sp. GW460-E13]|nr:hypothetical protein C1X33_08515 [Pseudomonas sp. GW460-E13]PMX74845.1 hypothetical protein C1X38_28565 [Pseudomonas sp. GW456-12-1-14-LB2]